MRVRLLIDVDISREVVIALGERCARQPVVIVRDLHDDSTWGGRLMGASPVESDPDGPERKP